MIIFNIVCTQCFYWKDPFNAFDIIQVCVHSLNIDVCKTPINKGTCVYVLIGNIASTNTSIFADKIFV